MPNRREFAPMSCWVQSPHVGCPWLRRRCSRSLGIYIRSSRCFLPALSGGRIPEKRRRRLGRRRQVLHPASLLGGTFDLLKGDRVESDRLRYELMLREAGYPRSEEHTSELQSLMRNSYAVFRLKQKNQQHHPVPQTPT